MTRFIQYVLSILLIACLLSSTIQACPFCSVEGKTLTQEIDQATFVVYGRLSNPRLGDNLEDGKTDLVIEKVIKNHEFLKGKMKLELNRYLSLNEETKKQRFLVFCDLYKGKADAYRGLPVDAKSSMPDYLVGALKYKDAKQEDRLRFFFKYLADDEFAVSNDAFMEFGYADYKDYKGMATELPEDTIQSWLKDPKTASYRIGLYASMLGHCAKDKKENIKLLRTLVEDPETRVTTGVDGILAAIVMIDPKAGWSYLKDNLGNDDLPFTRRYAALRSVRFLLDFRQDLVNKEELLKGLSLLLDQADIADLAVEDLRKRKVWGMTDAVLALTKKKSHDIPIVRRSILRFALSSPKAEAATFVKTMRKKDSELVSDTEELLKLEQDTPTIGSN